MEDSAHEGKKRSRCPAPGRLLLAAAVAALAAGPGVLPAQQGAAMQQRLAAVKQAAAANQQALRKYGWTENLQISVNGQVRSTKQMSCQYGPDGKSQCTPVGPPPEQSQQGGIRGRIIAEKKEEMTEYMQQVKGVIGLYVPPRADLMEKAVQAGNVSLGPAGGSGEAALVFKSYAQPGDSMSLDFAMAAKKLAALSVNTYLGDPSSPVTLAVQFAPLPDGTNHPAQIVVDAPAKGIQVTVSNSNYQKTSM